MVLLAARGRGARLSPSGEGSADASLAAEPSVDMAQSVWWPPLSGRSRRPAAALTEVPVWAIHGAVDVYAWMLQRATQSAQ